MRYLVKDIGDTNKPTTTAKRIRDFLGEDARSTGEVATALGITPEQAGWSIGVMFRAGILVREPGPLGHYLYKVTRTVYERPIYTKEERVARKRDYDKNRRPKRPARSPRDWNQYLADLAEQRKATAEKNAAAALARKDQRAADRILREAARKAARMEEQAARRAESRVVADGRAESPMPMVASVEATATKAEQPRETVEEWMIRTNQKPEVLPLGAVSKPLLHVSNGHRALNEASWRDRQVRMVSHG